jgi:hypothetical protein
MANRNHRGQSKLVFVIAVCAALAAGVSTVWAAKRPENSFGAPVVRVMPVASPVEINPCAAGACW